MRDYKSLAHTKWDCKYHVVFTKIVGFIKGKSAISIARGYGNKTRNIKGENLWARSYFVSTVGLDEAMVREYIQR